MLALLAGAAASGRHCCTLPSQHHAASQPSSFPTDPHFPPSPPPPNVQVALQRKMFEQYEKRERQRKVAELQDVVPGLTVAEAERALELCDGR